MGKNWPNSQDLELLLTDIVREFLYKRRSSVGSFAGLVEKPESQGDAEAISKDESPQSLSEL
jgi:hypothetical protein